MLDAHYCDMGAKQVLSVGKPCGIHGTNYFPVIQGDQVQVPVLPHRLRRKAHRFIMLKSCYPLMGRFGKH